MNFFVYSKLYFVNSSIRIFIWKNILYCTKILSPMIHDGEIFFFIGKGSVILKFFLSWFVFTSLIFLHFLSVLLKLDVILCLFDLINILFQTNFIILWLIHIFSWTFLRWWWIINVICKLQLVLWLFLSD